MASKVDWENVLQPDSPTPVYMNGFNKYYRKHIIDLGNRWLASCNRTENCPELWINEHCAKKVCLIHPQQKQAVMDSSGDVTQLKALLEKYKEW